MAARSLYIFYLCGRVGRWKSGTAVRLCASDRSKHHEETGGRLRRVWPLTPGVGSKGQTAQCRAADCKQRAVSPHWRGRHAHCRCRRRKSRACAEAGQLTCAKKAGTIVENRGTETRLKAFPSARSSPESGSCPRACAIAIIMALPTRFQASALSHAPLPSHSAIVLYPRPISPQTRVQDVTPPDGWDMDPARSVPAPHQRVATPHNNFLDRGHLHLCFRRCEAHPRAN